MQCTSTARNVKESWREIKTAVSGQRNKEKRNTWYDDVEMAIKESEVLGTK